MTFARRVLATIPSERDSASLTARRAQGQDQLDLAAGAVQPGRDFLGAQALVGQRVDLGVHWRDHGSGR